MVPHAISIVLNTSVSCKCMDICMYEFYLPSILIFFPSSLNRNDKKIMRNIMVTKLPYHQIQGGSDSLGGAPKSAQIYQDPSRCTRKKGEKNKLSCQLRLKVMLIMTGKNTAMGDYHNGGVNNGRSNLGPPYHYMGLRHSPNIS